MLFWIISGVLALAVTASLVLPLLRRHEAEGGGSEDVALYREQLAEVERDVARGVLDPEEAERARTEIARRLLAADRAAAPVEVAAPRGASLAAAFLAVVVLLAGSLWLYNRTGAPGIPDQPRAARLSEAETLRAGRISQAEAEAIVAGLPRPEPQVDPELLVAIERLRELVPQNADNLEGWEMLVLYETQLGNYAAAAHAQAQVVALRGDEVTAQDLTALVDRMVAAARGHVSPEADEVIERLDALDPGNLAARYYAGLMHLQTGRPDLTFTLWRSVIETAPEHSLHRRLALAQMDDVSFLAGRDYTPPPAVAERGPSAEDIAAAADLDPEVREQMVRGMVAQLAERLAVQGGSAEDWARLIGAYAVLGEIDTAGSIWAEARVAFAASEPSMAILTEAARAAGLPLEPQAPEAGPDDDGAGDAGAAPPEATAP